MQMPVIDIEKYDAIIARGLSRGVGQRDGQMCIEAALCAALDLPHDDDPQCVAGSVRRYKIRLNDSRWSSPQARAAGLRDLGLAQLGSKGVVDDRAFARRMAEKTIRVLIPKLFRQIGKDKPAMLAAADRCEQEGSRDAAAAAAYAAAAAAAYAAAAADAAAAAAAAADAYAYADAYAAAAADAAAADAAAAAAAYADEYAYADAYAAAAADAAAADAAYADEYLRLSASLALETLRELNSPGIALLIA